MNYKFRICSIFTAFLLVAQQLPIQNVAVAHAASATTLDDFASKIHIMTSNDERTDTFDTLIYDKNTDMLYRDEVPMGQQFGDISVQNGTLYLQDTSKRSMRPVYEKLSDVAEEYGYTFDETSEKITLTNEFQTSRLIVKAKGALQTYGAFQTAEGYRDLHILQYGSPKEAYAAYQRYQADERVEFVQASHVVKLDDPVADIAPTSFVAGIESHSFHSWGADDIGVQDFITDWLDMEMYPEVIVAVVDTGVNRAHSELAGRILDDEVNYSDSGDDTANDDMGHGTHCIGTICELTTDNVKILPVKVFDNEGSGTDEEIYLGLMYALEHGADIVSMSFGGLGVSPLEVEAMAIAEENGMTCVAAAGNNSDDASYYYPGGIPSCITVAAVDSNYQLANFSNYGSLIDVSAPGVGITSLTVGEDGTTVKWNGTSMATPHVTACCALLKTLNPEYSPAEIQALLQANAIDIGEKGFDKKFGWGLVSMKDFDFCSGICHAPVFSMKGGNYGNTITTKISCPTESASIYYTLDGSIPSVENGILYTEPLVIEKTTRIRAIAVQDGYRSSTITDIIYMLYGAEVENPWVMDGDTLISYRGVMSVPQIPAQITAIGENAFAGNTMISKIVLPASVTEIGAGAFAGCTALKNFAAEGVSVIGESAFSNCALLETASFSSSISSVGARAFAGCEVLKEISLLGAKKISEQAFFNCIKLQKAMVPDAVEFGNQSFANCVLLSDFSCKWEAVTAIGNRAFEDCPKLSGEVCLSSLETFGEAAFRHAAGIQGVLLPENITELPNAVFEGCSGIMYFSAPNVTKINDFSLALGKTGYYVVSDLPYEEITYLGTSALSGFNLGDGYETVSFDALDKIAYQSFSHVYAGTISFPNVVWISPDSFQDAVIRVIEIPKITSLAEKSVCGCSCVVISDECTEIAENAGNESTVYLISDSYLYDENSPLQYQTAPVLLRYSSQSCSIGLHGYTELSVLAAGHDLTYHWYRLDDSMQLNLIEEADSWIYVPDSTAIGKTEYVCIASANGQDAESVHFVVEVTGDEMSQFSDYLIFDGSTTSLQSFRLNAENQYISACGDSRLLGVVTDESGNFVSEFAPRANRSDVLLPTDGNYYLHIRQLFDGVMYLTLHTESEQIQDISLCSAEMEKVTYLPIDEEFHPSVIVTAKDGSVLGENSAYLMQRSGKTNGFLYLFGIGAFDGYLKLPYTVYYTVNEDSPAPVALKDAKDTQTYVFVPKESADYYYYSTFQAAYKTECETFQRKGTLSSPRSYNFQTSCEIYDSKFVKIASNSYSTYTGNCFNSKIKLVAGQTYYFVCKSNTASRYNLMISQVLHDMKKIDVDGSFYAKYDGKTASRPELDVTLNEDLLVENEDYVTVYGNNDVPGIATATIVGIGKYVGSKQIEYRVDYHGLYATDEALVLDKPQNIQLGNQRIVPLWFNADSGQEKVYEANYFISMDASLNLRCAIFRYNAAQNVYSYVLTTDGKNSVSLKNGMYCFVFYSMTAEKKASTNVTVYRPYNLTDAEITVQDVVYTGGNETPDVTVISNGMVLQQGEHFNLTMPVNHAMFGEQEVMIVPAGKERAYGNQVVRYQVYVQLPEEAPQLTIGEHEVNVTLDDRLAIYQLGPYESDTTFLFTSTDVMNTVLRVFDENTEMIAQCYGTGTQCMNVTLEAGKTYYFMGKFNSLERQGKLHLSMLEQYRLLSDCVLENHPVVFTGEKTEPQVSFTDDTYQLEEGKDYSQRYCYDNEKIGTACANFVGKGDYSGSLDLEYDVIAENLFSIKDFEAFPMLLDTEYTCSEKTDCDYMIYRYTSGFETQIRVLLYGVYCKMTLQIYDENGQFVSSRVIDGGEDIVEIDFAAGQTYYFLLSATNINKYNQTCSIEVQEHGTQEIRFYEDKDNGVTYRICPAISYAEVYSIQSEKRSSAKILNTVQGIPVQYVSEACFVNLPELFTIYGYNGCAAADYSEKYGFAYLNADVTQYAAGDLNGDDICSIADAVLLSHVLAESDGLQLNQEQFRIADFNQDGMLTLLDLRALFQLLLA